jgi:Fe-S-cluster-containing dehydrogenase component
MPQVGWKIDLRRCTGCDACTVACVMENQTPPTVHYRNVVHQESGSFPNFQRTFVSAACNHCEIPACKNSCPVNAIRKMAADDPLLPGAVLIDQEKCTGCRHCEAVCPYGAPQFNEETQKMNKCTMCNHRLEQGLRPACESTCVGKSIRAFIPGDSDAPTSYPTRGTFPDNFADPKITKPAIIFVD